MVKGARTDDMYSARKVRAKARAHKPASSSSGTATPGAP